MKNLFLYKWLVGTQSEFTKPFQDNENLFNQAKAFWHQLEGIAWLELSVGVVIGILGALLYFGPFNDLPGRHYKVRFWVEGMVISAAVSLIVSLTIAYFLAQPNISGAFKLESHIAFGNLIYAALSYFIVSLICWNYGSTNAYRLITFRKYA